MIVSKPKILIEGRRYGGSQNPHIKYCSIKQSSGLQKDCNYVSVASWVKLYLYLLHQNIIRQYLLYDYWSQIILIQLFIKEKCSKLVIAQEWQQKLCYNSPTIFHLSKQKQLQICLLCIWITMATASAHSTASW